MENIENLELNSSENVETVTTEESTGQQDVAPAPKTYTQEELDEIVGRRLARNKAKITKEFERKYGALEDVLKAGTGKESVEEMTSTFKEFYRNKGINIPETPSYSAKDIEVLARAEADEIIRDGLDEVVEEVERLAAIGAQNMTPKEKAMFKQLAEYRQNAERTRELSKIGVTEKEYNSKEFKDFASKFNASTPISDIYDIYNKTKPKKEVRTMGSVKNTTSDDSTVKDFYTRDEALRFTKKDFDKNPALFKAVEQSMLKW